jgi:hypothetical protein
MNSSGCAGIKTMSITVALKCFTDYIYIYIYIYIYVYHLELTAISHFFTFHLGFPLLLLTTMEDKRETKRPRSPSKEASSSPSSVSTPPSVSSGSSPPPGSPSEVSSRRHRSPVFEQGGPSERISVVDLSSDEEDLLPDTLWDEDFARRLFGDLNRGLLGLPGDGRVIIISDSNEEKEAREEDATDGDTKCRPLLIYTSSSCHWRCEYPKATECLPLLIYTSSCHLRIIKIISHRSDDTGWTYTLYSQL